MKKLRSFLWLLLSMIFAVNAYGQEQNTCTAINNGFDTCLGDMEFSEDPSLLPDLPEKGFNMAPFSLEIHGKIGIYQTYTKTKTKKYPNPNKD